MVEFELWLSKKTPRTPNSQKNISGSFTAEILCVDET